MRGRVDLKEYYQGANLIENFITLPQGGVTKVQGGAILLQDTNLAGGALLPYVVQDDSYLISINPNSANTLKIKIIRLDDNTTPYGLLGPTTVMCTVDYTTYSTEANISNALGNLNYVQNGDSLIVCSEYGGMEPIIIYRTSTTAFKVSSITNNIDSFVSGKALTLLRLPYMAENVDQNKKLVFDGVQTLRAKDQLGSAISFFKSSHVGSFFKLTVANDTGCLIVTAYVDASTVTVLEVIGTSNVSTDNWQEAAWSNARGWPKKVTSYQSRLIFANNFTFPDTIWNSKKDNPYNFMSERLYQDRAASDVSGIRFYGDPKQTDAFWYTVLSSELSFICWLNNSANLEIGTTTGEYIASGLDNVYAYDTAAVRNISSYGSYKFSNSIRIGNSTIYPARYRNTLQAIVGEGVSSPEINAIITSLGLISEGVISSNDRNLRLVYCRSLSSLIVITASGTYFLTFNAILNICSLCKVTIPGQNLIVVDRTHQINYCFDAIFYGDNNILHQWIPTYPRDNLVSEVDVYGRSFGRDHMIPNFLKNSLYLCNNNVASTVFLSNANCSLYEYYLSYGTTVSVIADCKYIGEHEIVINPDTLIGSITFKTAYKYCIIGTRYSSKLETMNLEAGNAQGGTSHGLPSRIDRVTARLIDSYGGNIGPSFTNMEEISYISSGTIMGAIVTLQDVDKQIYLDSSPDEDKRICVEQDLPFPFTLLSLIARGITYD
jgi:hypothetical protein